MLHDISSTKVYVHSVNDLLGPPPWIACDPFFVWAIFKPDDRLVPYEICQAKCLNAILAATRDGCPSKWHDVLHGYSDEECLLT